MSAVDAGGLAQQSSGKSYGVDTWMNVMLEPMMKVWQGIGGNSNFFSSEHDVREAIGAYQDSDP